MSNRPTLADRARAFLNPSRTADVEAAAEERSASTPWFPFNLHPLPPRTVGFDDRFGGPTSAETIFAVSAFHACVRAIAESIAVMPFRLMRKEGDRRVPATDSPLFNLAHRRPNPWMSSYSLIESQTTHVATWGNAYLLKKYGRDGQVEELWPLHPSRVEPYVEDGRILYSFLRPSDGSITVFDSSRIVHTKYLSDDDVRGLCPATLAGDVLRHARVMDLYSSSFWENDARPSVILEASRKEKVSPEAAERLRKSWEDLYKGPSQSGRVAMLPPGVTATPFPSATNDAAQWVEIRRFIVEEIARALRVPTTIAGMIGGVTYANAEAMNLAFLNSLVPFARRIESAWDIALLDDDDLSFSLDMKGLLRGDSAARAAFYTQRFALGTLSPNDIRRLEDETPIDDPAADEYFIPVNNYTPLSRVYDALDSRNPAPAPAAPPEPTDDPAPEEKEPEGEDPIAGGD